MGLLRLKVSFRSSVPGISLPSPVVVAIPKYVQKSTNEKLVEFLEETFTEMGMGMVSKLTMSVFLGEYRILNGQACGETFRDDDVITVSSSDIGYGDGDGDGVVLAMELVMVMAME